VFISYYIILSFIDDFSKGLFTGNVLCGLGRCGDCSSYKYCTRIISSGSFDWVFGFGRSTPRWLERGRRQLEVLLTKLWGGK